MARTIPKVATWRHLWNVLCNSELRHFISNILLEALAHAFEGNALEDGIEESLHNQFFGFSLRDTARFQVEKRLLLQFANGCAVCTAHIVREDFQAGDGIGARLIAENEVAVCLIAICLLRARRDVDHALPDRAALAFERAFEEQVAGGVRGKVILLGIVVEVLVAVGKVEARHASLCAFACQVEF